MELEKQVCSLELSKELLTRGIKQDRLFYWYYAMHDGKNSTWDIIYKTEKTFPDKYAAFTASELLDMLPNRITLKEGEPFNSFIIRVQKSIIIVFSSILLLST